MTIQNITHPNIIRGGVKEASEYFKQVIPGWVTVSAAGVLYYPPSEWEPQPQWVTIHINQDDWEEFHDICLWNTENKQEGIIEGNQHITGKDIRFTRADPL